MQGHDSSCSSTADCIVEPHLLDLNHRLGCQTPPPQPGLPFCICAFLCILL